MEKDIAYKHTFHFNGINSYTYKVLICEVCTWLI